jgi:hypothetical protein
MIRLRQVALAARHLDRTVDALCSEFGLTVCYRDPGVATFGAARVDTGPGACEVMWVDRIQIGDTVWE